MIKLTDFIIVPDEKKTKVKFNMNAGDTNKFQELQQKLVWKEATKIGLNIQCQLKKY